MQIESEGPTAKEMMAKSPVSVRRDMTIAAAAKILLETKVSSAPVVAGDGDQPELVGFVSESDLMQSYANGLVYGNAELPVDEVMRIHPISIKPETGVFSLAAIFLQHEFRHVPVTEDNKLLGVVSRCDVLAALAEHCEAWQRLDPASRSMPDLESISTRKYIIS